MDDSKVSHFVAGGKRGAPPSPAAAKALAAIRALPNIWKTGGATWVRFPDLVATTQVGFGSLNGNTVWAESGTT